MKITHIILCLLFAVPGFLHSQSCICANFPFDSSAADITGNGYDGTVMGATLAPDRYGNPNSAYSFNGTTDYIELNNNLPVVTNSDFSISAWTKVMGQEVRKESARKEIYVGDLAPGLYGIRLLDSEGRMLLSRKILIHH